MATPTHKLLEEPGFRTIVESEQYNALTPEKRKELLGALKEMTPEERGLFAKRARPAKGGRMAEALGQAADPNLTPLSTYPEASAMVARELPPLAVDIAGQAGGAALGSLAGPAGAVAGEIGGAVAADRLNRALGLRDPKKASIPFVGDIPNEPVVGPVTTGDILAGAPTVQFRW